MSTGIEGTISARVRWQKGGRMMLLRTYGNWLELAVELPIPDELGSPGLVNSRRVAHAAPAVYAVAHTPVLH